MDGTAFTKTTRKSPNLFPKSHINETKDAAQITRSFKTNPIIQKYANEGNWPARIRKAKDKKRLIQTAAMPIKNDLQKNSLHSLIPRLQFNFNSPVIPDSSLMISRC